MKEKIRLIDLFGVFFKVGIMTFGGGLAMLPILEREICVDRDWATNQDLLDYYSISQCTPGIIAVNTATFVGYSKRGVLGGIVATLGMIFPSLLIITVLGTIINKFKDNPYLIKAFSGVRVVVCALILKAVLKLIKTNKINTLFICLIVASLALKIGLNVSSTLLIVFALLFSLIYHFLLSGKNKGGNS